MRHYIAYNKVQEWGDYSVKVGDTEFGHYSGHHRVRLEKMIGQTIWVISGEKVDGSMVYKLCSVYTPTIIDDGLSENGFRYVSGQGLGFVPPIKVNGFQWFTELFKEQNKFSFGLSQIKSEFVIRSLEALRTKYLNKNSSAIFQEIEQFKASFEILKETTRESIVQSRIGQGQFRVSLIQYWQGCSVTSCQKIEILKASHIKPWHSSSNEERLDVFNGLLLLPNLDACFDSGLIGFADNGKIIISSELDESTLLQLGINTDLKLLRVDQRHKKFLRFHCKNIFRS